MTSLPLNPRHSLLRQLLVPLLLGLLAVIGIITTLIYLQMSGSLSEAIITRLDTQADRNRSRLQNLLHYQQLNSAAWARLEVMDDLITEDIDGRIHHSLQELAQSYQLPGRIYLFDQAGLFIASSQPRLSGQPPRQPVDWNTAPQPLQFIARSHDPLDHTPCAVFLVPVFASFDPGRALGLLAVTVPWSTMDTLVSPPGNPGLLLDSQGGLLSGNLEPTTPDSPANSAADQVSLQTRFLSGQAKLTGLDSLPLNWTLLSLEERDSALRPLRQLTHHIMWAATGFTLLLIPLLVLSARWVVTPIQQMTETIQRITQSADLTQRVTVNSSNETGILANSFNRMTAKLAQTLSEKDQFAARLADLNRSLEHQVSERTAAYRAANDELQATIAQLQQAQHQLIRSEKMASLGQLVAGIAHEINNPLGSINANIPILNDYATDLCAIIDEVADQPAVRQRLAQIDYDFVRDDTPSLLASMKNAVDRMKQIVISLRNFSRLDQADVEAISVNEALDTTLALLAHKIRNRIDVRRDYQLHQPLHCYAGLINQVLMNLLANAEQAISGEGTITVSTREDNGKAIIAIADTGCGMSESVLSRIFDPFYTTKPVGQGTGMGLAIAYGIIEDHSGQIQVTSEPGQGTTFTLILPLNFTPSTPGDNHDGSLHPAVCG